MCVYVYIYNMYTHTFIYIYTHTYMHTYTYINRHLLLVTLLLGNSAAAETLPIFLDRISTTRAAIFLSVTLILIFSEIIPQV